MKVMVFECSYEGSWNSLGIGKMTIEYNYFQEQTWLNTTTFKNIKQNC